MDKDEMILFSGSKEEIAKQPRNCFYFNDWKQFSKLLNKKGKQLLGDSFRVKD